MVGIAAAQQAVVEDSAVEQLEAADSAVVDSTVEEAFRTAVAVDMVAEATGKF